MNVESLTPMNQHFLRDTLLAQLMSEEVMVNYHDQSHPLTTTVHE